MYRLPVYLLSCGWPWTWVEPLLFHFVFCLLTWLSWPSREPDSSVGIEPRLWAGRQRNRGSIPGRNKNYWIPSPKAFWPTQLPVRWVSVALCLGLKGPRPEVISDHNLAPRQRINGAIPPRLHMPLGVHMDNVIFIMTVLTSLAGEYRWCFPGVQKRLQR